MAEEKSTLLAKLDEIELRYSEIEKQLADPAIASDSARLVSLAKEQGKLKTIVTKYREYKQ
jgi:peptide chain release factor 1